MQDRINVFFFELLQVAIGNREVLSGVPSPEEWEEIYETAKKQTLVGITFKGVEKLPQEQLPPRTRIRQWFVKADKIRKKNEKMNVECAKTCYVLAKAGFHSCIIKGQANLRNYGQRPSPPPLKCGFEANDSGGSEEVDLGWYRTSGDIDVWAWGKTGKVSDVIKYCESLQEDVDPHYHHVDCCLIGESETEVHYRPSWMCVPWRNRAFQKFCNKHKMNVERCPIVLPDGRKTFFFVPSREFDAVYQLVHIYRHLFAEGIGLRQMLDYCMVLQQLCKEQRVSSYSVLCKLGMKSFVAATMYVMQEVFGMKDEYMLCASNKKRGQFLLKEIMLAGNFGHEDERYTITREENVLRWGVMKLKRNMKFVTSYPEEVLCEPLFRVFHWAWRTLKLWKY